MHKINQFLKFEPILKEKIWGGEKLITQFNKKSDRKDIGESWEISDVENNTSIVAEGELKGIDLKSLITKYKGNLVGERVYAHFGNKFPLLIKFIDATKDLSLQVHPNDIIAQKRHNSLGKTEMWYVLNADKEGNIIIGFSEETDKKSFFESLSNGGELELLNVDYVKKGDAYLVPAGRIHAIRAGVLLAEIQETSDITYRVSDWGRTDANGNSRELHVDLAIDAIDYSAKSNYKAEYLKRKNKPSTIVDCKYFTTNFLHLTQEYRANHQDKDSFVIYMCVDGEVEFLNENHKETLKKGETILVPACLKFFSICPKKKSELLEVYIK